MNTDLAGKTPANQVRWPLQHVISGKNSRYFASGAAIRTKEPEIARGIPANDADGVNSAKLTGGIPVNLTEEQRRSGTITPLGQG
ncbi:hypothetical protein [Paenibacillus sp. A14]|uniref:hypothetical protein n=1 Tax=Paenibacillus sp. A14 TaxID=3119820 RepID=UPI002FE11B02